MQLKIDSGPNFLVAARLTGCPKFFSSNFHIVRSRKLTEYMGNSVITFRFLQQQIHLDHDQKKRVMNLKIICIFFSISISDLDSGYFSPLNPYPISLSFETKKIQNVFSKIRIGQLLNLFATVCPRSLVRFHQVITLYKIGHDFLNIQYVILLQAARAQLYINAKDTAFSYTIPYSSGLHIN